MSYAITSEKFFFYFLFFSVLKMKMFLLNIFIIDVEKYKIALITSVKVTGFKFAYFCIEIISCSASGGHWIKIAL